MLYVQQSLGPNEELVHIGKFHWMYTVHAFMSIFWGLLISVMLLAGSVFISLNMGKIPPESSIIEAIRHLHPGIRALSFLAFVMGLLGFAQKMVAKATTEIAITNTRLVFKRGLVARQVGEMNIDRIEGVNVLQSVLGRILNYGRIMVRGMGIGEVVLPPIEDPVSFRKAIERAKAL